MGHEEGADHVAVPGMQCTATNCPNGYFSHPLRSTCPGVVPSQACGWCQADGRPCPYHKDEAATAKAQLAQIERYRFAAAADVEWEYGKAGHESQLAQDRPLPPTLEEIERRTADVTGPVIVDLGGEARGLIVGPDEVLVVVVPGVLNPEQAQAHHARMRAALGDRFLLVVGDNVLLAKVKDEHWARPAIGGN